ncbi:hypothetical protein LCGC14_0456790 [marine sediment metagenome]|uniref:Uncharacterized protein n=1 Tax=marine sediment metagenome TaxID=412755 RepID=A0A0F9SZ73_9ZZZZ|nr:hypothetical protein [Candidatus Aminicenantes bacterium]
MGYLGCKKCILEKRQGSARIEVGGNARMNIGGNFTIQCMHHKDTNLTWIDEIEEKETHSAGEPTTMRTPPKSTE